MGSVLVIIQVKLLKTASVLVVNIGRTMFVVVNSISSLMLISKFLSKEYS